MGLISGSGRSPDRENDNPLQYSCLEYSMNRGTWRATVQKGHKDSDTTGKPSTHMSKSWMKYPFYMQGILRLPFYYF